MSATFEHCPGSGAQRTTRLAAVTAVCRECNQRVGIVHRAGVVPSYARHDRPLRVPR